MRGSVAGAPYDIASNARIASVSSQSIYNPKNQHFKKFATTIGGDKKFKNK